jgi:transcriptional regulator with XRE-family HTH domain
MPALSKLTFAQGCSPIPVSEPAEDGAGAVGGLPLPGAAPRHGNQVRAGPAHAKGAGSCPGKRHPGKESAPHNRRGRTYDGRHEPWPAPPGRAGRLPQGPPCPADPPEVGLPETGTRWKVAGLRREEVAQLAAISVDYLTRLEQGRVQASASVLITLSRALRLDEDQQAYLYQLAGKTPRPRRRPAQQPRPAMRRLLGQLTDMPAVVLGRRLDILDWNRGATALYTDFARIPARRRNYVRLLFTDPAFRGLHAEREHDARTVVASLR